MQALCQGMNSLRMAAPKVHFGALAFLAMNVHSLRRELPLMNRC